MLNKSELSSLDFVINRLFIKLFRTNNIETVEFCQDQFGFDEPSILWAKRVRKFDSKFVAKYTEGEFAIFDGNRRLSRKRCEIDRCYVTMERE